MDERCQYRPFITNPTGKSQRIDRFNVQVLRILIRHEDFLSVFCSKEGVLAKLSKMIEEFTRRYNNDPDEYLVTEVLVELACMSFVIVLNNAQALRRNVRLRI